MLPLLTFTAAAITAFLLTRWAVAHRVTGNARVQVPLDDLPDLLEGLALCVEAGMDLMLALRRMVAPRKDEPLPGELFRMAREVEGGATRVEAWRRLSERLDTEDVRLLVASLLQAESLGTGPARILRTQAEGIRLRRFHHAERVAAQAPVKLMLPMVCIVMAVFLLIFGAIGITLQQGGFAG